MTFTLPGDRFILQLNCSTLGMFARPPTQLLQNPVYIGKVRHRDELHEGLHDAILIPEQFDTAQSIFAENRNAARIGKRSSNASLLTGILTDPDGRPMSPSHAKKGARRYRYYISRRQPGDRSPKWRMPSGEIERLVIEAIAKELSNVRFTREEAAEQLSERIDLQKKLAEALPGMSITKQRAVLLDRKMSVQIFEDRIDIAFASPDEGEPRNISFRTKLVGRGYDLKLVIPPHDDRPESEPDPVLLRLIAQGFAARELMVEGRRSPMVEDFGQRHLYHLTRLSYLAPDIIASILSGTQPVDLTGRKILRISNLPLCWKAQREMLGFA